MKTLSFCALSLLLTGCATGAAQLKALPPVTSKSFPTQNYHALASCTMEKLETVAGPALSYRLLDIQADQRANITGAINGLLLNPSPAPIIDISFTKNDKATQVESRIANGPGAWGSYGQGVNDRMWSHIEKCSESTIRAQ